MFTLLPPDTFQCYLENIKHTPFKIPLPTNEKITIGRRHLREPYDTKVPLRQLILRANVVKELLQVKVVGAGQTSANGIPMKRGVSYILKDGDVIQIQSENHSYRVCFEPLRSGVPSRRYTFTKISTMRRRMLNRMNRAKKRLRLLRTNTGRRIWKQCRFEAGGTGM